MKGISAVIAVILVLIITVGLGASAWMLISGVITGRIATSFDVIDITCNSILLRNTGTVNITSLTVYVDDEVVPIYPQPNIAPGTVAEIYLGYVLHGAHVIRIATPSQSLTIPKTDICPIYVAFAAYGDSGGDNGAITMALRSSIYDEFRSKTNLRVITVMNESLACDQQFTFVDTEDLSKFRLIYFHAHGGTFSFSPATEQKLLEWVKRGGMLVFDDCGGVNSLSLPYFGISAGLNGNTDGSVVYVEDSDIYREPFSLTESEFANAFPWNEGGATDLVGLKTVVQQTTGLVAAVRVGNGWVVTMGGDWGCGLNCYSWCCSARNPWCLKSDCPNCPAGGNTNSRKILFNLIYIASGRGCMICD
jgi:hypothetical protein